MSAKFKKTAIALFIMNIMEDSHKLIWKGALDQAEKMGVRLVLFPGEALKSQYYPFVYQGNMVYELADPSYIDGIIMMPNYLGNCVTHEEMLEFINRYQSYPMVTIGMKVPGTPFIHSDNTAAVSQIVQHLVSVHKRKNIVFISGPAVNADSISRLESYREGMRKAGLAVTEEMILPGDFSENSGIKAVRELLDSRKLACDAIVCANDSMAIGALNELKRRGIKVPEDIAITGYDNSPDTIYQSPSITTVKQPIYNQVVKAMETLVNKVQNKPVDNHIVLPTELVFRESCGCPPRNEDNADKDLAEIGISENIKKRRMELLQRGFFTENYSQMTQDIMLSHTLENLTTALMHRLPESGINHAFIYLFNSPILHRNDDPWIIPEKANLILALDLDQNSKDFRNGIVPVADFIPDRFMEIEKNYCYGVFTLYFHEYCYGYMIIEQNSFETGLILNILTLINTSLRILQLNELREQDQSLLRKRNMEMEKDIVLARKIQSQLVPENSPKESIDFIYKPMDEVGGDFFYFIEFHEKNWVGIFISDVSGHGVAAAFITSMIKSTIIQSRVQIENPAYLLQTINESLYNQTGGNFVTAFYGIYIIENRKFIFANAGHNIPYQIRKGKVDEIVNSNRSIPLGIKNNQEMLEENLAYTNLTIQLEEKDKLILYTDGLTDAVSRDTPRLDFETTVLKDVFSAYSSDSAKDFVHKTYDRLVDFHGSDKFSDDVCIVCLDVR